jgi:hypothetical protein
MPFFAPGFSAQEISRLMIDYYNFVLMAVFDIPLGKSGNRSRGRCARDTVICELREAFWSAPLSFGALLQ